MKIYFGQLKKVVFIPARDFSSSFYALFYSSTLFEKVQAIWRSTAKYSAA